MYQESVSIYQALQIALIDHSFRLTQVLDYRFIGSVTSNGKYRLMWRAYANYEIRFLIDFTESYFTALEQKDCIRPYVSTQGLELTSFKICTWTAFPFWSWCHIIRVHWSWAQHCHRLSFTEASENYKAAIDPAITVSVSIFNSLFGLPSPSSLSAMLCNFEPQCVLMNYFRDVNRQTCFKSTTCITFQKNCFWLSVSNMLHVSQSRICM